MKFAFWRRRSSESSSPGGEGGAGGISRTSQAVALTRARMERPHSPGGDPLAQSRLCEGMRPTAIDRLRPMLAARTQFFDEAVLSALAAGTRQVVICGAGYDDRALRFRTPEVRFFELDQGPTQADKARRLHGMDTDLSGLTLATADFRHHDVAAVLAANGHDREVATLFLCEGLLIYLDRPTLTGLLAGLASRAAPGSTLAASLAIHAQGRSTAEVLAAANARRRAGETEPWRTILPRDEQIALLASAGWHAERVADAADLEVTAPPGRTLLVEASPAAG
jgi:methyltransferase (TIGR00027 family)